jgi:hypothetical protein
MKYHPTLWTDAASARAETNLFVNDCGRIRSGDSIPKQVDAEAGPRLVTNPRPAVRASERWTSVFNLRMCGHGDAIRKSLM